MNDHISLLNFKLSRIVLVFFATIFSTLLASTANAYSTTISPNKIIIVSSDGTNTRTIFGDNPRIMGVAETHNNGVRGADVLLVVVGENTDSTKVFIVNAEDPNNPSLNRNHGKQAVKDNAKLLGIAQTYDKGKRESDVFLFATGEGTTDTRVFLRNAEDPNSTSLNRNHRQRVKDNAKLLGIAKTYDSGLQTTGTCNIAQNFVEGFRHPTQIHWISTDGFNLDTPHPAGYIYFRPHGVSPNVHIGYVPYIYTVCYQQELAEAQAGGYDGYGRESDVFLFVTGEGTTNTRVFLRNAEEPKVSRLNRAEEVQDNAELLQISEISNGDLRNEVFVFESGEGTSSNKIHFRNATCPKRYRISNRTKRAPTNIQAVLNQLSVCR